MCCRCVVVVLWLCVVRCCGCVLCVVCCVLCVVCCVLCVVCCVVVLLLCVVVVCYGVVVVCCCVWLCVVVVVVRTLCLYDVPVHATQLLAMNWVAGHLGIRLPATSPPLLRPNGGGQPWPCACAQGPTSTSTTASNAS